MALGSLPTLLQINTELGTTLASLATCIENAGKTGVWDSQLDFAGYTKPAGLFTVTPNYLIFGSTGIPYDIRVVTVQISGAWTVSDNQSWITTSPSSGTGNGTFSVYCGNNSGAETREGLVTVTNTSTGLSKSVTIDQDGMG